MALVSINMDRCWQWWPEPACQGEHPTVEVPDDVLAEYNELRERWARMQDYLEHAYRHQMLFTPFEGSPFK